MKFSETHGLWKINLCLLVVGMALCITGFASDYVVTTDHLHGGFWTVCFTHADFGTTTTTCWGAKDVPEFLDDQYHISGMMYASRALVFLALFSSFAAILLNCSVLLLPREKKLISLTAVCLTITSVVIGTAGLTVLVARGRDILEDILPDVEMETFKQDWSFSLLLAALGVYLCSGLLQLTGTRPGREGLASLNYQPAHLKGAQVMM